MSKQFKNPNAPDDRFRSNNRGQDVPIDTFLYACLEAEQAVGNSEDQTIKWPTLTDLSPEDLDDEFKALQLQDIYEDLMSWYAANYPDLSTNLAWDYGVVSLIVQPLVSLAQGLDTVHSMKFGEPLPDFDESAEERNSVWLKIRALVDRFFASKSNFMLRYLEWSFGKEKAIEPEPGSRPPVGRYSPGYQNRNRNQGGGGGGGNRDRNRGPRGGGNQQGRGGPQRHPRSEHDEHAANQRMGNQKHPRGGRGDHRRRGPQEANAEMEAAAIQECKEAFTFLDSNPGEESVVLKPQNSFYRRIQHQVIVSNGYDSESTGENQDRAVVIYRKR